MLRPGLYRLLGLGRVGQGDAVVSAEVATVALLGEATAVESSGLKNGDLKPTGREYVKNVGVLTSSQKRSQSCTVREYRMSSIAVTDTPWDKWKK